MASDVQIINRGLQSIGAKRIQSRAEDSKNARESNFAYDPLRLRLLRKKRWGFAKKRDELAKSTTAPVFGPLNAFPLPSDYLYLITPDPRRRGGDAFDNDWEIESIDGAPAITTDFGDPLSIVYIADIEDANAMDVLFREALSMLIAWQLAEPLTQSNVKVKTAKDNFKDAMNEAAQSNAFERGTVDFAPEDEWIAVRGIADPLRRFNPFSNTPPP